MTIQQIYALEIIYDLAEQNVIDKHELPEEYEKQMTALAIIHDFMITA